MLRGFLRFQKEGEHLGVTQSPWTRRSALIAPTVLGRLRAAVAVTKYGNASWRDADAQQIERIAYMLEAVASAATIAVAVVAPGSDLA